MFPNWYRRRFSNSRGGLRWVEQRPAFDCCDKDVVKLNVFLRGAGLDPQRQSSRRGGAPDTLRTCGLHLRRAALARRNRDLSLGDRIEEIADNRQRITVTGPPISQASAADGHRHRSSAGWWPTLSQPCHGHRLPERQPRPFVSSTIRAPYA